MPILNSYLSYEAITALTQEVLVRIDKHFKNEEMKCIEESVQRDAVLGWFMQSMPPAGFTSLRRRYLNQQRAANQAMMNVHDPIFAGLRQETARWLSALPSSVRDSYPSRELSAYKNQLQSVFNDIKGNLLESFYPDDQEKKDAAEKDFTLYLDHIFEKYEGGATGLEHLVYALQWAQAAQEIDHDQLSVIQERQSIVFNALNEARTAYEQEAIKYVLGHDWSCMPGLDERILDTMGTIKRSLEPEIPLEQQPFYKQYATRATDEFMGTDSQPSPLFNSLCMRALMPAYETKTISISDYDLTKDQQLIEAARAVYLEDQKLAVQAAQDSYVQWCQGQRALASLQPSQERINLRRQQAWLYSAFQEFLDIKTEEDGSETIKGLYEEQALQDLLIKKFNTQISNPATIKEQPWAQGLVIKTTRSLDVVAHQQAIFESAFDAAEDYRFKMSDEELMELIAQFNGVILDHIQLLNTLMAGGSGLSWFKESLLADKPIPCLAVEALETKLDEMKSQLLALSLRQIERDPSAYLRHLVDDRGLIEAIAAIINHQDMNHLMLPCQDTLLAHVVVQITDSDRRNRLATLCVEHGFSLTLRILLSGNLAVDANYIDEERYSQNLLQIAINKDHVEIVRELLAAGADINLVNREGRTPLFLAAENGHTEIVRELVRSGADVNLLDRDYTPLHWAAIRGRIETVRTLLEFGADINLADRERRTPLFLAAENGHTEIVKELVRSGADINLSDRDRNTPLTIASLYCDRELENFLKEEASLQKGLRASLYDIRANDEQICKRLSRLRTFDLNNTENGDNQLLFDMAKRGFIHALDLLMRRSVLNLWAGIFYMIGDNINRLDQDAHTALYHAVKERQVEMVQHILNKYQPDLTIKGNDYETLFSLAEPTIQLHLIAYKNRSTVRNVASLLFSTAFGNKDKDYPNHFKSYKF